MKAILSPNKLVSASTRFGFKLFVEIVEQDPGKNIFISPSSVAMALAIVYNGAGGETRQAMAETLELQELSLEEVNRASAKLMETLENADPEVAVYIANSLWGRQDVAFKSEFMQKSQDFYRAEVRALESASIINNWVSEKTAGKINEIVQEIDLLTVLILINALYFKGVWTEKFDAKRTQQRTFTRLDGNKKGHPMTSQLGRYSYYEDENFQAVSLPYGTGRVSMYILLPAKHSSLDEFQKDLTAEN